ncbi:MAG TPA: hypothetical protein VF656_02055 [Pyrinomonadaceae bacterium]|jgi:hypothetical protein
MTSRTDNLTTDFQCGGKWNSWVIPPGGSKKDDKKFKLKVDKDTGKLTGKHGDDPDHDGKEINSGTCSDDAATKKHRMRIQREDDDYIYDYDGLITPDLTTGNFNILEGDGKRKVTPKSKLLEQEYRDDKTKDKDKFTEPDEWIAEKTT